MTSNVQLLFCTYFKKIEKFRYERETYGESVAFCVRRGAFSYRIGEGGRDAFRGRACDLPAERELSAKNS